MTPACYLCAGVVCFRKQWTTGRKYLRSNFNQTVTTMKLINIGFGNTVVSDRIISILSPESAPIKRVISEARDRTQLVDATYGRRTRAVIITDSGHVVLSAIQPETIAQRFTPKKESDAKSHRLRNI